MQITQKNGSRIIILIVHVDDIVIASNDVE